MKIKCEYCDSMIDESLQNCPNCGGINHHMKRTGNGVPKTIEELKEWYRAHNLPDEKITRFFIGKNVKEARAFGIYEEGGHYIVYKNKGDGSRAIRYDGTDEAYAVNELYLKLKDEIAIRKKNSANKSSARKSQKKKEIVETIIASIVVFFGSQVFILLQEIAPFVFAIAFFLIIFLILFGAKLEKWSKKHLSPGKRRILNAFGIISLVGLLVVISILYVQKNQYNGYYQYNNNTYCCFHGNWYAYDGYDYSPAESPFDSDPSDYQIDSGYKNFKDSDYYEENWRDSDWQDSDWDSDYSWDSGYDSWDSGGSDWGSDW